MQRLKMEMVEWARAIRFQFLLFSNTFIRFDSGGNGGKIYIFRLYLPILSMLYFDVFLSLVLRCVEPRGEAYLIRCIGDPCARIAFYHR